MIKLIFKGKHLEFMDSTLYEIQLEKDSQIENSNYNEYDEYDELPPLV
jgi:hypothetical protein